MDYAQVEKQFQELKEQLAAGKLDEAGFKAKLNELMVQDEQGRWWMIGYETGQWYTHDGTAWVRSDPPGRAAPAPAQAEKARVSAIPIKPAEAVKQNGAQPTAPLATPVEKRTPVTPPGKEVKKLDWGFWLGWIGSMVVGVIVIFIFEYSIRYATLAGVILGLIVGCLQWLIIRQHVRAAWRWIVANVASMFFIGAVSDAMGGAGITLILMGIYILANLIAGPQLVVREWRANTGIKA